MPLKPQDTSQVTKTKPAQTTRDVAAKDTKTRYGKNDDLVLNTAGEETQREEYAKDGLPQTQKYSVDKA